MLSGRTAPPTSRLTLPANGGAPGSTGQAILRCLHGPRPERRARRLVTEILADAGISAALPDAELAVGELVTNARLHAPRPYELRVFLNQQAVTVAVLDGGADHADLERKLLHAAGGAPADGRGDGGESGRGLLIVTGLFPGSWGIEPTVTCTGRAPAKQVWITVTRELPSHPAHQHGGPPAAPHTAAPGGNAPPA